MAKVSVIIPVYNVEQYLRQCLDSVVNQSLKDIEVICINDGSNDGSLSILTDYAVKDKRIVVLNQKNHGAGAARNRGLKIAKGEYLSFLDADDFFELNMLEEAYYKCVKTDADFIVFRSDIFHHSTNLFKPARWTIRDKLLPEAEIFCYQDIEKDLFRVFNGWAWDKLFNNKFIKHNKIQFLEQRTSEDMYFVYIALVKAEKITILPKLLAHHRIRDDSLQATRDKSVECFCTARLALKDYLIAIGIYDIVEQSFVNEALHASLWNLATIKVSSFEILYNKLKYKYFDELGISGRPANYFYNMQDYEQYLKIKNMTATIYLLDEIEVLREDSKYKQRLQSELESVYNSQSFRIGRCITFAPRLIRDLFRCFKVYGVHYTYKKIIRAILRKVKGNCV